MRDDHQANDQFDAASALADDVDSDLTAGVSDDSDDGAGGESVEDPAWRLTAWVLPAGAGASALLTAVQTAAGGLGAALGYPAALAFALLAALLVRDARRRAARSRWTRDEVYEYALPLGILLVALVLLAHGADVIAPAPALLALLPVAWEFAVAPQTARLSRLFPHALPVLNASDTAPQEQDDADDRVEAIVRDVLDGLPPDIAARLEPWSVDVQDTFPSPTPGRTVYGCCFTDAHVIAIYRRPHLRDAGRGEALRAAVAYTTLHEIAHALGLDEIGVRRLGWLVDRRRLPIEVEDADLAGGGRRGGATEDDGRAGVGDVAALRRDEGVAGGLVHGDDVARNAERTQDMARRGVEHEDAPARGGVDAAATLVDGDRQAVEREWGAAGGDRAHDGAAARVEHDDGSVQRGDEDTAGSRAQVGAVRAPQ